MVEEALKQLASLAGLSGEGGGNVSQWPCCLVYDSQVVVGAQLHVGDSSRAGGVGGPKRPGALVCSVCEGVGHVKAMQGGSSHLIISPELIPSGV
jgi:hypothetical protein